MLIGLLRGACNISDVVTYEEKCGLVEDVCILFVFYLPTKLCG